MTAPRILIVEDQASEREALARLLRLARYEVLTAPNPAEALRQRNERIDLIVSDLRMRPSNGVELLRAWRAAGLPTPFVMVTAFGDVESAVAAMKLGAEDYLTKPVDPDALLALVARIIGERRRESGDASPEAPEGFARLIGRSGAMLDCVDRARRAAATESTVLVLGESGSGKELMAEAIHHASPRRGGPFVAVNIAAIPRELVESELFGHVSGAFTGATGNRVGRFEAAEKGTLFIDEVGDFELAAQAKILRSLETRSISPVGSNEERKIDVRVVAATSRNLSQMVAEGAFREDLYYRLNVITIQLPPLRERREDIPLLTQHFLADLCSQNRRQRVRLHPDLAEFMWNYDWPGNVRQLRNTLESMVVLSRGNELARGDLPPELLRETASERRPGEPAAGTLEDLERRAILDALHRTAGNRTHAAEALGISVRTLQRKLKAWGMTQEPSELSGSDDCDTLS